MGDKSVGGMSGKGIGREGGGDLVSSKKKTGGSGLGSATTAGARSALIERRFTRVGTDPLDEVTWERLRQIGCDVAQGYFLCRPSPASQLTAWLRERRQVLVAAAETGT